MVQMEEDYRVLGKILAIDPSSKNMGWAIWDKGKYVDSGLIRYKSFLEAVEECKKVMFIAAYGGLNYLVVEDSYFHKNVASLKSITKYAVIPKVLVSEWFGNSVELAEVSPGSWQPKELSVASGTKRKERKRLSILKAKEISNKELSNDEADAINIGGYFVNHGNIIKKRKAKERVRKNSPKNKRGR